MINKIFELFEKFRV